jgi:cytochrome c553
MPFTVPAWAYPASSPEIAPPKPPLDSVVRLHLPHSTKTFTLAQVKDLFAPPDWYPGTHPRMPDIVARGRKPTTFACGYCHLPDGQGRSENATLAGLPAEYFARQVADMRAGTRHSAVDDWGPSVRMRDVARSVTDAEVEEAARYFASMRAKPRYKVVERASIPLTYEAGGLYSARGGAETEPIGTRIIEITESLERHEMRDATAKFIAFVPPGSLVRGRALATPASAKLATSCASCHGPALRGVGVIPPLAGRSPSYILRQLVAFKTGARAASTSASMQKVVSTLDLDDMIAAAAYAGSLRP